MHLCPRHKSTITSFAALFILAVIASIFVVPLFFVSEAGSRKGDGLIERTSSHANGIVNYDIRTDKRAYGKLSAIRDSQGKTASMVADVRDAFVHGEEELKRRVPSLKVEYNSDLRIPEVIAPDVALGRSFLTRASTGKRSDLLKSFLKENSSLIGVSDAEIEGLKVVADYANPDGNLSFVELNQEINAIPVFRGEIKAGFTRQGEIIRVINNLAPGVDTSNVKNSFDDPATAVNVAAASVSKQATVASVKDADSKDGHSIASLSDGTAAEAEKIYFPTEAGVAIPAWRVMIGSGIATYYTIVDAENGTLLWRKNLTEDQTQSATYNVYANPSAMVNVADNPFPMTPGPTSPNGAQGLPIARTLVTRIGNEAPYTFNDLGWITDGNNSLDGNNVQAGLDRELPNTGSPANPNDIDPNGVPAGSTNRVFDFPINPGVPTGDATTAGDSPLPSGQLTTCQAQGTATAPSDFQKAIATQLFYITNVYHDEMYRLGFTEAARNFQNNNFGRGGIGNDRISAQAQDCSGVNNANFTTPADGNRPTMQMFLFTGPTPDFDGSLDADVVIHELTHGISNRLHGNASGLGSQDMARAMGEGWSDFYAHSMLSEPTDPINGTYPTGGYATYKFRGATFTTNYYYGIRRFPKAVMAFTGGPNNRPHNPLTFADIDSTKINLSDGAFSPAFTTTADGVHAAGEIWSSALWEIRAKMVQRLGWETGNRRVLQLVTDGMKLAPINPTFLSERDAILAGALASGTAEDVKEIWEGFAIRGMGASASIQVSNGVSFGDGTGTTRVTEAFDLPNLRQTPNISVSDSTGNNNGFPEPGEQLLITVPLSNTTGNAATTVFAEIVGGSSIAYGTIGHNSTASSQIGYTIPVGAACGSSLPITINVTSSLGPVSFSRSIQLGSPVTTFTENFDSVTAPALPAGWTASSVQSGVNFITTTINADTAPNSAFALNPTSVGGGTDLTSPSMPITASAAVVNFRNRYDTEAGWDGGVLEISIAGSAFQDVITAGGAFLQNGYNGTLGVGTNNPLNGRAAWTGNSSGYLDTTVRLPASAAGQNVQLRWRFGADNNTAGIGPNPGWNIDGITVAGNYTCATVGISKARADFDGDRKTDLSVFRPLDGNWYVFGSTSGIGVYHWGTNGDIPIPADYDQDGKTDFAVYRPGSDGVFYLLKSNGFTISTSHWGIAEDIPVVRDYDGDSTPDISLYRPSDNTYYTLKSTGGSLVQKWGTTGDVPVAGDFDGDGKGDLTVYRNGTWITQLSSGGETVNQWGLGTDKPVPADYDGDGKDDIAVYRPESGTWYLLLSLDGQISVTNWGISTDIPVPGDYDGDNKTDIAVYRPESGTWYLLLSSNGTINVANWGLSTDVPIPHGYIP